MSYQGSCNGCGICCTANILDDRQVLVRFRCTNLLLHDNLGKPSATSCAVYEKRTLGMPIVMVSEDGKHYFPSRCLSIYPRPQDAIPPECSYVWQGEPADKPLHTILYVPKF